MNFCSIFAIICLKYFAKFWIPWIHKIIKSWRRDKEKLTFFKKFKGFDRFPRNLTTDIF